jgi:DNA-binding response OmpR family regulator
MIKPKPEHVLVVDDQAAIVDITRRVLEYSGFAVTPFTSSVEALHSLRERPERFDLVIADRDMPELDGAELAREVWRVRSSLPVLFVSAMDDRIAFEPECVTGRHGQLSKPYDTDALVASVKALVAEKH